MVETKVANDELDPATVKSNEVIRVITEDDTFHLVATDAKRLSFVFLSRGGKKVGRLIGTSLRGCLECGVIRIGGRMKVDFGGEDATQFESARIQTVSVFEDPFLTSSLIAA